MGTQLPDPKELIDSVADGVVEVAEGPVRVVTNIAATCQTFATEVKANMDDIKKGLPDDPSVLAEVAVRAVGQTAKAGIGLIEGIGKGVMDTFDGLKNQIQRVSK